MTEWDSWYRDDQKARADQPVSPGAAPAGAGGPAGEPTVNLPGRPAGPGPEAPLPGASQGGWPAQPAQRRAGPPRPPSYPGAGPGGGGPGRWRRRLTPRRVIAVIAVLLSLALIGSVATYFYLDSQLTKKNFLVDYADRPAAGAGQNWLITGSDSRQGLTDAQIRRLHTGFGVGGQRSDTIMVLHLPAGGGRPVLISIPRDSYLPIPGFGSNKINAAFALGGPRLLARTIQNATGLRIEHYMGIGFGGFVRVVNAIGGVRVCLKRPLTDPAAGLHLKAGCQTLNGAKALGYVRSRHLYASQDLQRIQNQRIFLRALLRKLTSAGVLLNPFRSIPAVTGVAGSITVDSGTSLYQLIQVAFALRNPLTTTVPIGNFNFPTSNAGDAVLWDTARARALFTALNDGKPVPKGLLTGSAQGG